MATYTPDPRGYELMVLLSPELGDEALESEMQRISDQITQTGAEILRTKSTTPWGRRRLAYQIENHTDAFYVLYSISSQPGSLDPFERELKLNSNVLRYLLIRQEKAEPLEDEPEAAEAPEAEEPSDADPGEVAEDESAETNGADDADEVDSPETEAEPEPEPAEGSDEEQS